MKCYTGLRMKIAHESEETLKREIRDIIGKHLDIRAYKVFFFGSRVSGKNREGSDIDVGIEGVTSVPAVKIDAIQEEIDALPTLYKIEVVDFSHVTDKFKEVAREREYIE